MTQTINSIGELFAELETSLGAADYSEMFREFMPQLAEFEAGMFAGEYSSNLDAWAALKPSTVKKKGNDRILVNTGTLRESLVHLGGSGNIAEAGARSMLFGSEVEYATFHQSGTGKMPARPPIGICDETLDKICEQVAETTINQLKG